MTWSLLSSVWPQRRQICIAVIATLSAIIAALPAAAVEPGERLKDPALEKRARALSADLRCLVCQNQSIDDSDAPLARDLRLLVRRRLQAGDSDRDVLDYVVARYGEFVLLRPPFNARTILLWLSPLLVLLGVLAFVWANIRGRHSQTKVPAAAPLSQDEQRALDDLIGHDAGHTPNRSDRAS